MILRFKSVYAIFFLRLTTVISEHCKKTQFSLSVQKKAYYEQAILRCIGNSDTYLHYINRTELDISICQLEDYLRLLQNSVDGALQSSNTFKALAQNWNGHLSLCDLIFGAYELKKEFIILDTVFHKDGQKRNKMEKTDIVSLVKVVDDQCDASCHVCPESLCNRTEWCAYNVSHSCFQTDQPTLTPTDMDPSEASANRNKGDKEPHNAFISLSSARYSLIDLVGTCIITWIVLAVCWMRNRKCTFKLCGSFERNMDQGLDSPVGVSEYSGGETKSTVHNESVCIAGDNVPGSIRIDGSCSTLQGTYSTARSSIILGGPLILERLEPPGVIRKSPRNPFVEKNQSFEKNKSRVNLQRPDSVNLSELSAGSSSPATYTDNSLEPIRFLAVERYPTVVRVRDVEENLQKAHEISSSSIEESQLSSVIALAPGVEKMNHMVGATSSESF